MAEKDYAASKLINLHSADGTTLLIPKIPLSTVDNNAYTVVDGAIVTKGAGVSLQAAVQAEIAAAIADDVVGNYVPWTDGSNVEIPGTLTVEGSTTIAALSAEDTDITGTLDVTGAATLSATLDVTGAATLKSAVRVEGKLVATQDMYIETTTDGSTTSTKVATMADIDGITGGTLNNYYTKGEVDAIAEGVLEDANAYTDAQDSALREELLGAIGSSIDAIDHLKREIVDELPAIDSADPTVIYMVPTSVGLGETATTIYTEYMVINDKWETLGDSAIQLTQYYTKSETDTAIADALDSLKVDGRDLKTYIDAQDAATSTAAVTAANGYTDAASSTLNAAIVAVDNKFANYYDKDGIVGLGYATITQVSAASAAAVAEANGYTDTAIAGINKELEGYATILYVDAQDAATSTAAVTAANGYTDQQLANYIESDEASQAFILRSEIALPYSHIVYTSVFGSHTFDLEHGTGDNSVTVYTAAGVDDKFAPLDGATLTNVVSITGDAAHITVSKVTTTELLVVDEVQLAGIIIGSDVLNPAAKIDSNSAMFGAVEITNLLTVGDDAMQGSANIKGTLDATSINVASDIQVGSNLVTAEFNAGQGALVVNTSTGDGSTTVAMGDVFQADLYSSTVTMGSMFQADLGNSTVKVYDEWQVPSEDGSSTVTSTGLANVATEHDIAATSSSIMQVINALPGVGEGAILYDVLEDELI